MSAFKVPSRLEIIKMLVARFKAKNEEMSAETINRMASVIEKSDVLMIDLIESNKLLPLST